MEIVSHLRKVQFEVIFYNYKVYSLDFLPDFTDFSDFRTKLLPLPKSTITMQNLTLLDGPKFQITLQRLCRQLIENHNDFSQSVLIGIQPRGIYLAKRIAEELRKILPDKNILQGDLDITFYRDDFRRRESQLVPNQTKIDFIIEGKKVVMMDDVLWTGRTIRAAMDALQAFGRPEKIELLALVDRRYSRHIPVAADYVGIEVDSIASQKVVVSWKETDGEDRITLLSDAK
ncbi:MAG: pyrimidine operon attenuation protein / uracil phosphoribosyltransferase [Mucilaginibacter sp.]|nr:pyrimidine operon attenuation protein / uracil phosphoribosyltransferase [Mucilaginibacter sp.]